MKGKGGGENIQKLIRWEGCEGKRYQSTAILRPYPVIVGESDEEVQNTG
jgi:hypothetical protein